MNRLLSHLSHLSRGGSGTLQLSNGRCDVRDRCNAIPAIPLVYRVHHPIAAQSSWQVGCSDSELVLGCFV